MSRMKNETCKSVTRRTVHAVRRLPAVALTAAVLTVLTLALSACSRRQAAPEQPPVDTTLVLVTNISKCSRLYAAEMQVHKIVTHDDMLRLNGRLAGRNHEWEVPFSKRKIAIPMNATMKAYIDFSHFTERNVARHGDKITITLPDPRVMLTSTKIDQHDIQQQVSVFRSQFTDAEMATYEQQGREAIIANVPQSGIIDMARENAARMLIPLIVQMGYREENITITYRKQFGADDWHEIIERERH